MSGVGWSSEAGRHRILESAAEEFEVLLKGVGALLKSMKEEND